VQTKKYKEKRVKRERKTMGKWSGWWLLLLLAAAVTVWRMPAEAKLERPVAAQLLAAVEGSGAKGVSIQVRMRAELGQASGPAQVKALAEAWAHRLDIPVPQADRTRKSNLHVYQVLFERQGVQGQFQVTGVPRQGAYDVYLVLSLTGSPDTLQYIGVIQDSFDKALTKADMIPQISTCVRGMYSVKLSVDQQEGKILAIFRALHAMELERLRDDTVVSISGYTPAWKPFIALNDKTKMNLQVATHRDSQSGTWITVGTPIITAEY
jgi:hypothetical protein